MLHSLGRAIGVPAAVALGLSLAVSGCGSSAVTPDTIYVTQSPSATDTGTDTGTGTPAGSAVLGTGTPGASTSAGPSATATPAPSASATAAPATTPTPAPRLVATGSMAMVRSSHTATRLSDGKVLVAGGTTLTATGTATVTAKAEIYDPSTGHFTLTGSMKAPRRGHQAILLRTGKVLITGGSDGTVVRSSAELYDPATGTFSYTAEAMASARILHTQTLLMNGKVLVAGGATTGIYHPALDSAELYDPATDRFTSTGDLQRNRMHHSATLLTNGKVLLAGGWGGATGSVVLATVEIYDPAPGAFALTGSLHTARAGQAAVLLSDGRVLVAGGNNVTGAGSGVGELASAEIYSTSSGTFAITGSMSTARGYHTAALLSSGKVVVVGGFKEDPYGPFDARSYLATTEVFNPATGHFVAGPPTLERRRFHTTTVLRSGSILVTGGECYQESTGHVGPMPWRTAELGHNIR